MNLGLAQPRRLKLISPRLLLQPRTSRTTARDKQAAAEPDGEAGRHSAESRRLKRRAAAEPIRTDLAAPRKRADPTPNPISPDDDDLMDELQSATLEQAKPMTVSKSPITPVFPTMSPRRTATGLDHGTSGTNAVRSVSNPVRGICCRWPTYRPVPPVPCPWRRLPAQDNTAVVGGRPPGQSRTKSVRASPSASRHWRSSRLQPAAAMPFFFFFFAPKERPSSTFFSVRRTSPRGEPSRSPSVLARASAALRENDPVAARVPPLVARDGQAVPRAVRVHGESTVHV